MSLLPQLPPTFEAAQRDVRATTQAARLAAAQRLKLADDSQLDAALDGLFVLLDDGLPTVRAAAAEGLGQLADARAVPRLRAHLEDADPRVRELSAIAIGHIGSASAHAVLDEALDSPHPEVRFQALAGYVEAEGTKDPARVLAMLEDSDCEVRGQAARALGKLGRTQIDDACLHRLRDALGDDSESVRSEAALALSELQDASGRAQLERALGQSAFRLEALEAAAHLGLAELRDPIARIASNWFLAPAERTAAMKALVRLDDPRGAQLLRAALSSVRARMRALSAQAAGEVMLEPLVPDLVRLARRGGLAADPAIEALARLASTPGAAREALERLTQARGPVGELARLALERPSTPKPAEIPES